MSGQSRSRAVIAGVVCAIGAFWVGGKRKVFVEPVRDLMLFHEFRN
jgi:hypothetical protein